jgi:hypothetical protein
MVVRLAPVTVVTSDREVKFIGGDRHALVEYEDRAWVTVQPIRRQWVYAGQFAELDLRSHRQCSNSACTGGIRETHAARP